MSLDAPHVFLMSPPRADWRVHGRANVFASSAAPVPQGAALREWIMLADAISEAGGHIAVLPAPDDASLTGMPYTAEAGQLGRVDDKPVFVLPNVTPPHRKGEAAHIARFVTTSLGLPTATVAAPWEGQGDVIDVGGGRVVCTSGEGAAARTSADAYDLVARFFAGPSLHLRFRAEPWFHGNTFLASFWSATAAGDERCIVVCPDALLPGERERLRAFLPGRRFVEITRDESLRYATNALQVGRTVIAPRGAPDVVKRLWDELGLTVVELDLAVLFGRGGGAGVCMTNRLALPPDTVPPEARWAAHRARLLDAIDTP